MGNYLPTLPSRSTGNDGYPTSAFADENYLYLHASLCNRCLRGCGKFFVRSPKNAHISLIKDHSINNHTPAVLIIEDEEDICFMLSNILRQKSFSSISVHSITAARNCLLNQTPVLIFLDNNLPDGKGIEYLSDLKKTLPDSKIVMITAYDTPNDKRLAMEQGADEFIGKPFNRQTIFSVVEKLLS